MVRHAPFLALLEQRHQASTLGLGVVQVILQAGMLVGIDDRGVVRVVRQLRVEAPDRLAVGLDEAAQPLLWHQHIVGCDAGLAGIERLAEGDAFGGIGQWRSEERRVGKEWRARWTPREEKEDRKSTCM